MHGLVNRLLDQLRSYVQGLGYDVVALTELRGVHAELRSKRLITCQDPTVQTDSGAGVALALSQRASDLVVASGAVGARIVWARLRGLFHDVIVVGVYIPYATKKSPPSQEEVLDQLDAFLFYFIYELALIEID